MKRLKELQKAKFLSNTLAPFHQPNTMKYKELPAEIIKALKEKTQKI
jgi:hypothetical protein